MSEKILIQICEIILVIAAFGGIVTILSATWYDLRAVAKKHRLRTVAAGLSKSQQPAISVIIYAHNNALTIGSCLQSIAENNYGNYRIIVADNASTDATKQAVFDYKIAHPTTPITIHLRKTSTDRPSIVQSAQKVAHKNSLVLLLDATDKLYDHTVIDSAAHFIANPKLETLKLRPYNETDVVLRRLLDHFTSLNGNMFNKAFSWHRLNLQNAYQSGTISRSTIFTNSAVPALHSYSYASTVLYIPSQLASKTIPNPQIMATTLKLLLTMTLIGMLTYFFYTAAILKSNTFLTLSWAMVSLWLIAIIWSDNVTRLANKLALTFTVPFMYFMIYAYLFVQVARTIRQLIQAFSKPRINIAHIYEAILIESYSTRF